MDATISLVFCFIKLILLVMGSEEIMHKSCVPSRMRHVSGQVLCFATSIRVSVLPSVEYDSSLGGVNTIQHVCTTS